MRRQIVKKPMIDFDESLLDYQEMLYIEMLSKQQKQLQRIIDNKRVMGRIVKK